MRCLRFHRARTELTTFSTQLRPAVKLGIFNKGAASVRTKVGKQRACLPFYSTSCTADTPFLQCPISLSPSSTSLTLLAHPLPPPHRLLRHPPPPTSSRSPRPPPNLRATRAPLTLPRPSSPTGRARSRLQSTSSRLLRTSTAAPSILPLHHRRPKPSRRSSLLIISRRRKSPRRRPHASLRPQLLRSRSPKTTTVLSIQPTRSGSVQPRGSRSSSRTRIRSTKDSRRRKPYSTPRTPGRTDSAKPRPPERRPSPPLPALPSTNHISATLLSATLLSATLLSATPPSADLTSRPPTPFLSPPSPAPLPSIVCLKRAQRAT